MVVGGQVDIFCTLEKTHYIFSVEESAQALELDIPGFNAFDK